MTLMPTSLTWRTLLVLIAALVLSQATALWLLHAFVTQPRIAGGVGQFVSHLKTISAALQTMSVDQQEAFIARIVEKEGIRISPAGCLTSMRHWSCAPAMPWCCTTPAPVRRSFCCCRANRSASRWCSTGPL